MNFVYTTFPHHTEDKIPLDQVIEMHFQIDLNVNTLEQKHFILLNMNEKKVEPVSFQYHRRILKVRPVNHLQPNTHYQFQLVGGEGGIKDILNRPMPDTYEIEFYTKNTESIKPPKILSPINRSIMKTYVSFDLEPVEDASHYVLEISTHNDFQNPIWPINEEVIPQHTTISFTPNIEYETGTYYVRIKSVHTDGSESTWSPTISFYYDGEPEIELPEEQPTIVLQSNTRKSTDELTRLQELFQSGENAPTPQLLVKSSNPKHQKIHQTINGFSRQIVIEFTEPLDPASISSETCYILEERN